MEPTNIAAPDYFHKVVDCLCHLRVNVGLRQGIAAHVGEQVSEPLARATLHPAPH